MAAKAGQSSRNDGLPWREKKKRDRDREKERDRGEKTKRGVSDLQLGRSREEEGKNR